MTAGIISAGYPTGMERSIEWNCAPVSAEIISLMRIQHGSRRGQLWERLAEFEIAYDLRNYRQRWVLADSLAFPWTVPGEQGQPDGDAVWRIHE